MRMQLNRSERHLAKVEAAGSRPVIRSKPQRKQTKSEQPGNTLRMKLNR